MYVQNKRLCRGLFGKNPGRYTIYSGIKGIQKISEKNLTSKIGNTYTTLIENTSFDKKYYIGRTYMDVPDMDGVIYIKNTKQDLIGKFVECKIVDVNAYDLIGEI